MVLAPTRRAFSLSLATVVCYSQFNLIAAHLTGSDVATVLRKFKYGRNALGGISLMSPNELSELAPLAKTLNEESNDLNKTIAALNRYLAGLNLGIEVWCGPWDEDILFQIGYAKVEDGVNSRGTATWELATRSCTPVLVKNESGRDNWEAKPGSLGTPQCLLRASRNVRVDGLEVIPEIIRALKARAESKIATIRRAKQLAADLSSDLPAPLAPRTTKVDTEQQPPKTRPRMLSEAEVQVVRKSAEGIAKQSQSPGLEMMRMAAQAVSATTEVQDRMRKASELISKLNK
jgi:hypothetical protein